MTNKTYRNWVIALVSLTLAGVLCFGALMYVLDPLVRYRGEDKGVLTYYAYSDLYSNPGIARNYDYDTVLVGTSMFQNTDVLETNTLLGCNMVKLTYSGGTAHNMKRILDICYENERTIDRVIWGLDEFQFCSAANSARYPLPEYMYDASHTDDLSYLLNVDIFYHYALRPLWNTLRGQTKSACSLGDTWSDIGTFGADAAIANWNAPDWTAKKPTDLYCDVTADNLACNILPLVEAHPETEFVFVFPPYSMLYWYNEVRQGTLAATLSALETVCRTLLSYDNVRLFFFQGETEITANLDNYKDYSHYHKRINTFMMQAIADGTYTLTDENFDSVFAAFTDLVTNFDYIAFSGQP